MTGLDSKLQMYRRNDDKIDFMYKVFEQLKTEVNEILLYGRSNSKIVENMMMRYSYEQLPNVRSTVFSPIQYTSSELRILPTILANTLRLKERSEQTDSSLGTLYEGYLTEAYLYGTGTCELFSIVGAYILATQFEVDLSIETLYSNKSHTYIRLHTSPEYIFDFWSDLVCEYTDNLTWNETLGMDYIRNADSKVMCEIQLDTRALLAIGERVFTDHNDELRRKTQAKIDTKFMNALSCQGIDPSNTALKNELTRMELFSWDDLKSSCLRFRHLRG